MLPQNIQKKKSNHQRQFEFTFFDPLVDFNRGKTESSSLKSVTVSKSYVDGLREPIENNLVVFDERLSEQVFSYKRVSNSEVVLSQAIFIQLGLS